MTTKANYLKTVELGKRTILFPVIMQQFIFLPNTVFCISSDCPIHITNIHYALIYSKPWANLYKKDKDEYKGT